MRAGLDSVPELRSGNCPLRFYSLEKVKGSGQECPLHTCPLPTPLRLRACWSVEFFGHPVLEGGHILRTAEKIPYQIIRRHGAAGLENDAAVAHGGVAGEQVLVVELQEEIFGDDFIPEVSVVGAGISAEMPERRPDVGFREWSKEGVTPVGVESDGV
jgi:hypothetical protein